MIFWIFIGSIKKTFASLTKGNAVTKPPAYNAHEFKSAFSQNSKIEWISAQTAFLIFFFVHFYIPSKQRGSNTKKLG